MKSYWIFIIFLLAILTLGAVSASDDADAIGLNDNIDDSLEKTYESNLTATANGNFKNLNDAISNAKKGSEIKLSKDYAYDKSADSKLKEGISVDKSLTINGKGHTINGKANPVFIIEASDVVVKNIVFKNTHIFTKGKNTQFVDCTFKDCSAYNGGAIDSLGNNLKITGCSFNNCFSSEGGAILSSGSKCTISKCNFSKCRVNYDDLRAYGGGAISSYGKSLEVDGCNFKDCYAVGSNIYGSGVIYIGQSDATVSRCSFARCTSNAVSGAIDCESENLKVSRCSFINCSAKSSKKAVYFNGEFSLTDSSFVNGAWGTSSSGYIYNVTVDNVPYKPDPIENLKEGQQVVLTEDYVSSTRSHINVDDVIIDGAGYSIIGNDIFSIKGDNVTIRNCNFVNANGTKGYYGAIYSKGESFTLSNCSFLNYLSDEGTVRCDGFDFNVADCSFINCSATNCGGAIYSNLYFKAVNCSFINCSAANYGGAIYADFNCDVFGCSFRDCSVKYIGDAIYFNDAFSLVDSSFVNGAWYSNSKGNISNVTVDDVVYDTSIFDDLKDGERITLTRDYLVVSPIVVDEDNVVIDANGNSMMGSEIFYMRGKNITVMNCNFADSFFENYNTNGAICFMGRTLKLLNCTFSNYSAAMGAAVNIYNDNVRNIDIINCSFTNCFSNCEGGAINVHGANYNVVNCSFIGCRAGSSGGAIYGGGYLKNFKLQKSSFINCSAHFGGAVLFMSDDVNVSDCIFINCSAKPLIYAESYYMYYNDGSYFKVKVFGKEGLPASGEYVKFKLDGNDLKTVKTDENGYAKVKITSLPKKYKITVSALGKTSNFNLEVKKVLSLDKVKIKKSAKKLVLSASLLEGKTPVKKKAVTFKFKGKTYKTKTNSKGIAKVTIKKSVLNKLKVGKKVTYTATYVKSTEKCTVKVQK